MKVAIVGAGAAGCRAAMLLSERGIKADVFEARDRIGGRLHTVPNGNGYYEAGGEWIDAEHSRVLGLIREFGAEPEVSTQWPGTVVFRDETCPEDQLWAEVEEDVNRVSEAIDFACLDLDPTPWQNVIYDNLDNQMVSEFLDQHTCSPRGRWFLEAATRSDEGDDMGNIGLLGFLVGQLHYLERTGGEMSAYRITNGGEWFCRQMLERAGIQPQLRCPLNAVERTDNGVRLHFVNQTVDYDRVILTLPPSAMLQINFDYVSEDKQAAWENLGMARTVKVRATLNKKVWEGSARRLSDLVTQQVWDAARGDAPPTLASYICGEQAAELMESAKPAELVLNHLDNLFPGARDACLEIELYDWPNDPFAGGGFPYYPPGYVLSHAQHLARPEGNLHFAGDYAADWFGFIEGALESAERVVAEVLG